MGSIPFRSRIFPACALLGLSASLTFAETSPLSILPEGFGLELNSQNAREKGMGEAGMASVNRTGPSIPNPSRTAFNEKTSFSATFDTDVDWLQDDDGSNRTSTFVIPDIALNFQTRWRLNLGLYYRQRFQRNFTFRPLVPNDSNAIQSYETEGGLYEFGTSLAWAPKNYLAFALGWNFVLGRERTIQSSSFDQNTGSELFDSQSLSGDTLSVRSTGGYPSVSATFRQKTYSLAIAGTLGSTLDRTTTRTITSLTSMEKSTGTRDLPWSIQVGGAFKPKANQSVVADFTYEGWDDSFSKILNPAFQAGAGYEFQGTGTPYEPYFRKIAYRGGLGFERLYLDETNLYFLTLGTGLPLGRRGNLLDIALKYGHRGNLENNLWTEDFIKLSATLTGVSVWGQPVRKRR
jgi:long-chain fatty acid transport protein